MLFLHTFTPDPIALTLGPLTIYWYGIVMAFAMTCALGLATHLAKRYQIDSETIFDLAIWTIGAGLIGARIYEIFLNFSYYSHAPWEIIQIWNGGLAIHGGILGGALAIYIFVKKKGLKFWTVAAILTPAVALGQAIGRWGNWFNQELFGLPTNQPWGIPIDYVYRPSGFETYTHFQPTFLYESIGSIVICAVILFLMYRHFKNQYIVAIYLIVYGILRFGLEMIKIDPAPIFLGLRWPQIMSLIFIVLGVTIIFKFRHSQSSDKIHANKSA
jgi:phosphatidylglycerol:prolipoprotein diacylglycerol transferase